jgi:hypothetical protein
MPQDAGTDTRINTMAFSDRQRDPSSAAFCDSATLRAPCLMHEHEALIAQPRPSKAVDPTLAETKASTTKNASKDLKERRLQNKKPGKLVREIRAQNQGLLT